MCNSVLDSGFEFGRIHSSGSEVMGFKSGLRFPKKNQRPLAAWGLHYGRRGAREKLDVFVCLSHFQTFRQLDRFYIAPISRKSH